MVKDLIARWQMLLQVKSVSSLWTGVIISKFNTCLFLATKKAKIMLGKWFFVQHSPGRNFSAENFYVLKDAIHSCIFKTVSVNSTGIQAYFCILKVTFFHIFNTSLNFGSCIFGIGTCKHSDHLVSYINLEVLFKGQFIRWFDVYFKDF